MNEVIIKPDGTEIPVQKAEGVIVTVDERLRALENNQLHLIEAMNSWTSILRVLVANSTQIYPQIDTNYQDNKLHIRAPKDIVKSTSLLLVLPTETMTPVSREGEIEDAEIIIHAGNNQRIKLSIVKEDYNGNIVKVQSGDIVANRLCVFRFDPYSSNRVILCHSLSFDSLNINKLFCNEAIFNSVPEVSFAEGKREILLSVDSSTKLLDELDDRYQKKILFGTETPEEYIANNFVEEGQIYIQKGE